MPRIKDISAVFVVFIMYMCTSITNAARELKHMKTHREVMKDDGKSVIVYQCTEPMAIYNRLSWYHVKGSKHIILNMTQNQNSTKVNKTLTLYHTLENGDNQTDVYCLKEDRTENKTIKEVVKWVQLLFHEKIPQFESAHVSIEPNSKVVYFVSDQTMRFVCRGSTPIDGRKLTWYFENYTHYSGERSEEIFIEPEFEIPKSQNYDYHKSENVLELELTGIFHLKRLFCAQDLNAQVKNNKGHKEIIRFGQRARSETVTLILQSTFETVSQVNATVNEKAILGKNLTEGFDRQSGSTFMKAGVPLWATILLAVLAFTLLISSIIAVIKLKKKEAEFQAKEQLWNRAPLQIPNENEYESVYGHGAGLLRRPKK